MNYWSLTFEHKKLMEFDGACNETFPDFHAIITLDTEWETDVPTNESIKACALHEMLHVVLGYLHEMNRSRFVAFSQYTNEQERVIRLLESIVKK